VLRQHCHDIGLATYVLTLNGELFQLIVTVHCFLICPYLGLRLGLACQGLRLGLGLGTCWTRYRSSSSLTEVATPLLELTCHMGSHSVICHPAEVTFQPLPQPKLVLDLATPEGCKAELT